MMPAAKHGDPQVGVDIHLCVVPPSPSPVPLPTPHTSVVFDPFDYIPIIGATVTVCGMKRATAGTNGIAIHIPPGFPFAPKLPDKDDELFMGSATVVADGDPFSHIGHPVLACQVAGMMSPIRPKKKGGPMAMVLPTVFNLAIPSTVFLGGPPTISLMGMAFKAGFKALGKFAKSGVFKRIRQKLFGFLPPGFLKCKVLRAEPVNILTGEVSVQQEDFTLPGRIPIEWNRSYASGSDHEGLCGHGWETPADTRLEIDPVDDLVSLRHPTVGPLFFTRLPLAEGDEAGELELVDGARLTDHGHEYRVRTKEDRIYHFPKEMARASQRGGLTYPIGRIADLCGNWLDFDRRGGTLTGINESAGRRIDIEIKDGRIREVALKLPGTNLHHTFVRYEYDPDGDLVSVVDALGNPYRFAYTEHHIVRHTDRNSLSFYYEYDKTGEDWRVIHSWGDGGLYDYRFEYIDTLNERRITDSLGNVSVVTLDERGLPICEIDPLGGRTIYEYDEAGRTTAVVDQGGHRTEYCYDGRGNLLELTRSNGTTISTEFDLLDRIISIAGPTGAIWKQKWDERGLLLNQVTPLGRVSHYEYDASGQLVVYTNPRGARAEFLFDGVGDLIAIKDALGRATRFAYDNLGNMTARADPLGRHTLYRYDARGRLREVRLPSGAVVDCDYDGEDNLVRYRDENGSETRLQYCGQGQIATRLQPDGEVVRYNYDTEERLIGVVNQRGETYHLKRDALGRVIEETDYWGQSRRYRYSICGHIEQSIDPLGRSIAFATDPLGRVRARRVSNSVEGGASWDESFDYDADGNLVACANPHIRIERCFDAEGRLLEEKQGDFFTIRNTYDERGNRTARMTQFQHREGGTNHRVNIGYDLLDRAVEIAIDDQPPITIGRDAVGQIVTEQLSPGVRREIEYSVDGLPSRQRVRTETGPLVEVAYAYDPAGNLIERRDAEFGVDKYTYDPVGRIVQHLDPHGRFTRFFNDPAGDRLMTRVIERQAAGASVGTRTQTAAAPHTGIPVDVQSLFWAREGEQDGTLYRFDRVGNLSLKADTGTRLEFVWDGNQRLVESRSNGSSTRYGYDPLGRRIFKETDGQRTQFGWDGDALASDVTGDGQREFVYYPDTFEPLAMLCSTPGGDQEVLSYDNDPNGCPIRIIDSSGRVQWAASYSAWADVTALHVNSIDNPIRLQGQYFDAETGLHYNRERYYDRHIGQFISQDVLRLIAGPNTFRFAPNTLGWIDPVGLVCLDRRVGRFRDPATGRFVRGTQVRGHFPHTATPPQRVLYRADPVTGQVTHFQVYDAAGLPLKRVDITGATHGGVPTPHVVEFAHNVNPHTGQVFANPNRMVRPAGPQDLL